MLLQNKFELDDFDKLVSLTDPQISPDGKFIVLVISRPDLDENKNKTESQLIDVATGTTRTLTYDRPSVSHPRWSPSGERIAFIAKDFLDKHPQFEWMNGLLKDRPTQPWTLFKAGETE